LDTLKATYNENNDVPTSTLEDISLKIEKKTWNDLEPQHITLSLESTELTGGNKNIFRDMFNIHMTSLYVVYTIGTPRIEENLNDTATYKFAYFENNPQKFPLQSINSEARISMNPRAELPLTLNKGDIIVYSKTLDDIGIDEIFEDSTKYDITKASIGLSLKYINDLPLPLKVTIRGVKADGKTPIAGAEWEFKMEPTEDRTPIDADVKPLELTLFKEAKSLSIEYEGIVEKEGSVTASGKVSLTLGIKVELNANIYLK
jgi:hypothetical protein